MAEEKTLEEQVEELIETLETGVEDVVSEFKTKLSELLDEAGVFDEEEETGG